MMVQSCPEASPVKWHLAHTSWFFETFVLREFAAGYRPFHPEFHWLFNSYYNSLGDMPEKDSVCRSHGRRLSRFGATARTSMPR